MKPAPFGYVRPRTRAEALDLLAAHGDRARVLAGGQSLLPSLALRLSEPELLVDIGALADLRLLEERDGAVRIGALIRHAELERSPLVAARLPLVAQALPHVAHPAIRNRGTLGGSLALADPAAELPACMVALDATMVIGTGAGERSVPAADFFQGLYATALSAGELLVRIEIPLPRPEVRAHFDELSRRHGDYAIVGLAALGTPRGAEVQAARLVFLGCGDRPVRARAAEAALEAGSRTYEPLRRALEQDLAPQADLSATPEMRLHLAAVLAERAAAALNA